MVIVGSAAIRFYHFEVVIEKEPEDESYRRTARVCPAASATAAPSRRPGATCAIQQHVSALHAHGEPVPQFPPEDPHALAVVSVSDTGPG
jgi:hypothetical protein